MLQALKDIAKINEEYMMYKRTRLYIKFIYRNEVMGKKLSNYVLSLNGVKYSKSNSITGKILIIFDEKVTSENKIQNKIDTYVEKIKSLRNSNVIKVDRRDFKDEVASSLEVIPYNENTKSFDNSVAYHSLSMQEFESMFDTSLKRGLSYESVEEKNKEFGLNILSQKKRKSLLSTFIESLDDPIGKVLLGAGVVSLFLGQIIEGVALCGIVLVQAAVGAVEQYKSENSLDSLKSILVHKARVIRNGQQQEIEAQYLVPGDIILLEAGDKIPADARIIECDDLKTTEASLTGEATPVTKSAQICGKDIELGSRHNMLFMGTNVLSGICKAVVVATGRNTEIGNIATMLDNIEDEPTPLQNKAERFINKLIKIYLFSFGIAGATALLAGMSFVQVLITGITFFLGTIPEVLPAIISTCMALSVQRMAKKNAIVRKLNSVETLGAADIICCDKTGTLTMNEMTVRKIYVDECLYNVSGSGYNANGEITLIEGDTERRNSLKELLKSGVLCNKASLVKSKGKWEVQGDPTEGALIAAAHKMKLNVGELRETHICIKEIPFDSSRRYMTSVVDTEKGNYAYCKGAIDTIVAKCKTIYEDGKEKLFTATDKERILSASDKIAEKGLRVLAFAYKKIDENNADIDNNFVFLGFVGMEDPPREGVKKSIQKCFKSGIKVVMITGDYMKTAAAIGTDLGLLTDGLVVSGHELDNMTDEELYSKIDRIQVFARTSPAQKYRIVKAFKKCGHVVAMTGDGVNDAPAIKEANIGIAMGMNGSDVAKDASCITLVDDNFSTIVAAIEEGRGVSNNIRSSMKYLFAGAIGEMVSIFLALATGTPAPLLPIHMIWINVVSETLLGSSLAVESPAEDVMDYPPAKKDASLIDKPLRNKIVRRGIGISISTFGIFKGAMLLGAGLNKARTLAFSNFIFNQIANVYDSRANRKAKPNNYMNMMAATCVALLLGIIYLPFLNSFFGTVPLGPLSWGAVLGTTALSRI